MKNGCKWGAVWMLSLVLSSFAGCGDPQGDRVTLSVRPEAGYLVLGGEGDETRLVCEATEDGREIRPAGVRFTIDGSCVTLEGNTLRAQERGVAQITAEYRGVRAKARIEVLERVSEIDLTDDSTLNWYGRVYPDEQRRVWIDNTASGFESYFYGTSLTADMAVGWGGGALRADVDGIRSDLRLEAEGSLVLAQNLPLGVHCVRVRKMSEQSVLRCALKDLRTDGDLLTPAQSPALKFEFYGDSITCGYGNLGEDSGYANDQDGTETYATMAAEHFGAQSSMICYSGISASLPAFGNTETIYDFYASYSASYRHAYDFSRFPADLVVINLGTNDASEIGKRGPERMIEGYLRLLNGIRAKQPRAYLLCIYGMMGVDADIDSCLRASVDRLRETGDSRVQYVPITANQAGTDGHPDLEGHRAAADRLISLIRNVAGI